MTYCDMVFDYMTAAGFKCKCLEGGIYESNTHIYRIDDDQIEIANKVWFDRWSNSNTKFVEFKPDIEYLTAVRLINT